MRRSLPEAEIQHHSQDQRQSSPEATCRSILGEIPSLKNREKEANTSLIEKIVAAKCKIVLTLRSYCRNILC
jgi:hypothetical protein